MLWLGDYFLKNHLCIYFACLRWCLLICLYSINVKKAEPIGPKFCEDLTWLRPWKVNKLSKFQKFVIKSFLIVKILKMRKKNVMKSANVLLFFLLYKEKKSWNRRSSQPSTYTSRVTNVVNAAKIWRRRSESVSQLNYSAFNYFLRWWLRRCTPVQSLREREITSCPFARTWRELKPRNGSQRYFCSFIKIMKRVWFRV